MLCAMNPIATELNQQLEGTAAYRLLSEFGRAIYFPKGIVAQAAEAGAKAKRFDATIGMAVQNKEPMLLDVVRSQVPGLNKREIAAYAPTGGVQAVREGWKAQMLAKNPSLKAEKIGLPMVGPGLTNGIFHAAELFVNPGDTLVLPDMYWDNYELVLEVRRGASVRTFPFFNAQGGFNSDGLRDLLKKLADEGRKKIIMILNFPNNPTGYSPTKNDAAAITKTLSERAEAGTDILAICDDAYYGLFYEKDTCTESLFAYLSDAHERILALKVDGSTKEDFVWGFRLGFMTFGSKTLSPPQHQALTQKLMGSIRASVSNSSSLGQNILLKAYSHPDYQKQKQEAFTVLERRYRVVRKIIDGYKAQAGDKPLTPLPFNSGYFMSFRCEGIGADELRLALLEKGVGTIALQGTYLRVAYSAVDEEGLEELYKEIFETAKALKAK